jgi:hypothetical protein
MTGRLVVKDPAFDHFFYYQEEAVALDNGCHGAVRVPLSHERGLSAGFREGAMLPEKARQCSVESLQLTGQSVDNDRPNHLGEQG